MMNKLVKSIREAMQLAGLKDGMTISFHHHLRNGDYVLNMVLEEAAAMGLKDLTVNASSIFDTHEPILEHIDNHVVTKIQCNYMASTVGQAISQGVMETPVEFRTHGGRPTDIALGRTPIDVAFIAAPTADPMGNCSVLDNIVGESLLVAPVRDELAVLHVRLSIFATEFHTGELSKHTVTDI